MPSIKKNDSVQKRLDRKAIITHYMIASGYKTADVARLIRMPYSTLTKRMQKPENIRLEELSLICKVCKIPEEERGKLI